jgi:uncharacterized protein
MELVLLKNDYSVYRFKNDYKYSLDLHKYEFASVTRTNDETSIVCYSGSLTEFDKEELGWKILKVIGPLDFGLIGIISKLSKVLADNGISIFVISTFDTDYIMVKNENIDRAIKELINTGYTID